MKQVFMVFWGVYLCQGMVRASLLQEQNPSRKVRLEHPLDQLWEEHWAPRQLGKCARDSMCSTKRCRKGRMGTGASGDNDAKRSEGHTALGAAPQHTELAWPAEFPPIPSSSE